MDSINKCDLFIPTPTLLHSKKSGRDVRTSIHGKINQTILNFCVLPKDGINNALRWKAIQCLLACLSQVSS